MAELEIFGEDISGYSSQTLDSQDAVPLDDPRTRSFKSFCPKMEEKDGRRTPILQKHYVCSEDRGSAPEPFERVQLQKRRHD